MRITALAKTAMDRAKEGWTEANILKELKMITAIRYCGSINTQREYAHTALLIAVQHLVKESIELNQELDIDSKLAEHAKFVLKQAQAIPLQ